MRGATLIGNGIDVLHADRRDRQRPRHEERVLRQGRPAGPGRHRTADGADLGADRGRHRCLTRRDLEPPPQLRGRGGARGRRRRGRRLVRRTRSSAPCASTTERSRTSPRRASRASACACSARRSHRLRVRLRPQRGGPARPRRAPAAESAAVTEPDEHAGTAGALRRRADRRPARPPSFGEWTMERKRRAGARGRARRARARPARSRTSRTRSTRTAEARAALANSNGFCDIVRADPVLRVRVRVRG